MVLEPLDDLGVAELEQARPLLDDSDRRPEGREHRRVLDPDHSRADDDGGGRDPLEQL